MRRSTDFAWRALIASGILLSTEALAQSSEAVEPDGSEAAPSAQIGDIIVTAQRRTENLQDVPIAVTAINTEALDSAGINGLANLQVAVPGLSFVQIAGSALPSVRGIGNNTAGPGIENSVATYIDDVYILSPAAGSLEFNNIDQIAVLKGPQGTLFGRNATGGVIQINTMDPGDALYFNGELTAANHKTIGGAAHLSGPLSSNIGLAVAGYYHNQMDGYARNQFTGSDIGGGERFGVRAKLKWQPGPGTVIRLLGDYAERTADLFNVRVAKDTVPVSGIPYVGPDFGSYVDFEPYQEIESGGVSLNVEQTIGSLTLTSITAHREGLLTNAIDSDSQPIPAAHVQFAQKDRQFTQELRLASDDQDAFSWMIGGFYLDAVGRYLYQVVELGSPPLVLNNSSRQTTKSIAVFAQATQKLGDRTNATAGIRYTHDKRFVSISRQVTLANGVALPAVVFSDDATFEKVTWRLSLDHRFSPELMAYASYNRGFKSGFYDPAVHPLNLLRPEVLDAYEIGLKADLLDRLLRINAAVYHYDYKKIQLSQTLGGSILLFNAEGAKIDGVDLEVTARPSRAFTVSAGFSYVDHRLGNFPNAPYTEPLPAGGNLTYSNNAKGNRLPMVPVWTANARATYTIETGFGTIDLNASIAHNDGYFEGAENRLRQKPFDIVNASIDVTADKLTVSLWARNLFNEFYATQLSAQALRDAVIAGDPRTYGITIGMEF